MPVMRMTVFGRGAGVPRGAGGCRHELAREIGQGHRSMVSHHVAVPAFWDVDLLCYGSSRDTATDFLDGVDAIDLAACGACGADGRLSGPTCRPLVGEKGSPKGFAKQVHQPVLPLGVFARDFCNLTASRCRRAVPRHDKDGADAWGRVRATIKTDGYSRAVFGRFSARLQLSGYTVARPFWRPIGSAADSAGGWSGAEKVDMGA